MDTKFVIDGLITIKGREFQVISLLGSGTEGDVYKIQNVKSQVVYACKVVSADFMGNAIREARFMRTLYTTESRTPKVYAIHCFPNKTTAIVMEYIPGETLLECIQTSYSGLQIGVLRTVFKQLLLGLRHMHLKGIAHRDLKCENIMISADNTITIIDFGFATEYSDKKLLRDDVGSMAYAPPEVLEAKPYRGPEVDIYTMGVIFYTCMTGRFPYCHSMNIEVNIKSRLKPVVFKPWVPADLKALISTMLSSDQEHRYHLSLDIDKLLAHPFFTVHE